MSSIHRLLLSLASIVAGVFGAVVPAVAQGGPFEPVLYELKEGSTIVDACLACDRLPTERPLSGTMVLTRLPVRISGELYSISAIHFSSPAVKPEGAIEYVVRGTGSLRRGGENLLTQSISLNVSVNDTADLQLTGEVEKADAAWPAIDLTAGESVDPLRDPFHTYSVHLVAAPKPVQGVLYELVQSDPGQFNGSIFTDDCQRCGRVTIPLPIEGTFFLRQVGGGADGNPVSSYKVEGIDFHTTREGSEYILAGDGDYTQGGEVALLQSMDLTVSVNAQDGVILSSGGKVPIDDGVTFPDIRISLDHLNPTSQLHVYSLQLVARPVTPSAEPDFRRGDANADGSADISDAVFILHWRFSGGSTPGCLDAADVDADGVHNLTDAVYLLLFLFQGGPEPPAPGAAACGPAKQVLFGCVSSPCGV
jgi:hypothetical protein